MLDDDGVSPAGMVAYWNLDEGAGPIAADTSVDGLDNSGTLQFDATWSAEGAGGSLQFDGIGDYVDIPDSRDINVGIRARHTVALWFKVTDASISSRKQVLYEQGGISRGLSMYVDEESVRAVNPTLTLVDGTVPVRAIEPSESVTKERRHTAFDVVYGELGAGATHAQNWPGQATRPTAVPERRIHSGRHTDEVGEPKLAGSLLATSEWVNRI